MRPCPRCGHDNEEVMMICTRCGGSLHRDQPILAKGFYARAALWLILGVLVAVLVLLVLMYLENANKLTP